MKKGFITALGLMQLFFTTERAAAQQTTLDPVTVSSSLSEKRISETGRNITIVPGEDILKLPVHSIDELLRYIPGVEIQARGPQGAQSDISIRGGTYQQVLVILDGLRLNDPNSGHFASYIPITPVQIDRIEILKGASAAIYGSDAVGGVINIITKSFNAAAQQNKKALNAQVGVGEYNLVNTNLGGFINIGKLSMDAGLLSNHSTGVPQRGINGFFHNTSASAGINFAINEHWNIAARSSYDNRDFAAQNFYTTFASDTATEKVTSWWHQLRVSYKNKRSSLSFDAGYKNLDDLYAYSSVVVPNQNNSKLLQGLLLFQQQLGEGANLTAGLNFQRKTIESNDRGTHAIHTGAPFVSFSQRIGKRFNLVPSVRVEFIGDNDAELLPQLNASYRTDQLQLRASGGRTIRDAEFTERYNNYNKTFVRSGSVGNPWLVPEAAWTYEAGADWFYGTSLRVSSTFFQRFHTRLIDWVTTPYADMPRKDNLDAAGTYALAKNIAAVNTSGFETDVQYRGDLGANQRILLNGGVVWLYSKSSEKNASAYISSHARFLGNFNVQYEIGNAALSLTGIYKTRAARQASGINAYVSKDYFVMNARASYNFLGKKLGAFIQADNVFDRTYSDRLGAVMPGRWMQAGFNFRIAK